MILQQGVLALLLGSAIASILVLGAAALGAWILRGWDTTSGSEGQLARERLTHLVTNLTSYALGFHVVSAVLFIATLEHIHPLFTGAMCATGSLNANPIGWWILPVKGAGAAFAAFWLVINRLDNEAVTFPLLRLKYRLLFVLAPLVLLDGVFQARYFLGLDPVVITSCCGSLFSEQGSGVASSLSALPPALMIKVFFGHALLLGTAIATAMANRTVAALKVLALIAAAFLPVALAAVVSFISVFIYELPTHHCPFDMLQRQYHFVGYPLYASLGAGVFLAVLPGLLSPLRTLTALRAPLERRVRGWLLAALFSIIIFMALATYPLLGTFTLVH